MIFDNITALSSNITKYQRTRVKKNFPTFVMHLIDIKQIPTKNDRVSQSNADVYITGVGKQNLCLCSALTCGTIGPGGIFIVPCLLLL